jgi:phenylalanyl-tRNA synthetase alpha subunit
MGFFKTRAKFQIGWAIGFGMERIAMRRCGISDIPLCCESYLQFLKQF